MFKHTTLLLAAFMLTTPVFADTPLTYQRIDFQTDVEKEIANDLLSATLSVELNNKNPALLAKELTTITNESLKLGSGYSSVKLTSGNQQTYPISQLQAKLQLNNLNFTVAPETRRELENQLISEAVSAFRARADKIKSAWNAKSYKLVQMNLGTTNNQQPQPMYMVRAAKMEMADAAPAADYAGGQSRLNVQVSGSIELEN